MTTRQRRLLALLGVAAYLAGSWYPFRLDPPGVEVNAAERTPAGIWRFEPTGLVTFPRSRPLVRSAVGAEQLEVELEVRSEPLDAHPPARILSIAGNLFDQSLVISQQGTDLVIRLRRPGSADTGEPQLRVPDVIGTGHWQRIVVRIDREATVRVDGDIVAELPLPDGALHAWPPDHRLSLGNERSGGRPWAGEMRAARIIVDGALTDLLPSGGLRAPPLVAVLPDRLATSRLDPAPAALSRDATHAVTGFVLGLLVTAASAGPLRRVLWRGAALVLIVNAAKIVVATRHPSVAAGLLQLAGFSLAALLVVRVRKAAWGRYFS